MSNLVERLRDLKHECSQMELRNEAADRIEALQKQLPESMQECTIRFDQCAVSHGSLTADS